MDALIKSAPSSREWPYKDRGTVWSDVFVVAGYRAKLSLFVLREIRHLRLGVNFYICRGPEDCFLRWPFTIPFTLSFSHRRDASKNPRKKIMPCVRRPADERGSDQSRVHAGLLTVNGESRVFKAGFIEDDAACVSVTLHA